MFNSCSEQNRPKHYVKVLIFAYIAVSQSLYEMLLYVVYERINRLEQRHKKGSKGFR
jgi:hypothetical protein